MARRVSVRSHLSPYADCVQDGSVASSRRSSGRSTPARGGARQAPQKRGLAQGRRPVRPATPEDDDEEEGEGDDDDEGSGSDEDASAAADGERGTKSRTSTLAKEVLLPLRPWRLTRRRTWIVS
jgi:hypothetical protein